MRTFDDIDLSQLDQMLRQLQQQSPKKYQPQTSPRSLSTQTPHRSIMREDQQTSPRPSVRLFAPIPQPIQRHQDLLLNKTLKQQFEPYRQQAQRVQLKDRLSRVASELVKILPQFDASRFLKTAVAIRNAYKTWLQKCRNLKIKVDSPSEENQRIDNLAGIIQSLEIREALKFMKRLHTSIEKLKEKYYQKEIELNEELVRLQRLGKINPNSSAYLPLRTYKKKHKKEMLTTQDFVDAMENWSKLLNPSSSSHKSRVVRRHK